MPIFNFRRHTHLSYLVQQQESFALAQLTHRNISQNHKFQAVGLGWVFADSVLLEANANLVLSISLAALGSLMWLRTEIPSYLQAAAAVVAEAVVAVTQAAAKMGRPRTGSLPEATEVFWR
ncbi:uncharacterized protein LOC117930079 [Vitis riparia]|uniref:uncharacterized protein LOC117930079 n=1 Tax=Vitis riparia TaxID=96939 RepID=UPI00155B2E60|nr:uncharacterized protein LOC117930079 [Vitis riparia]